MTDQLMEILNSGSMSTSESTIVPPNTPVQEPPAAPDDKKKSFMSRHKTKLTIMVLLKITAIMLIILIQLEAFIAKTSPSSPTTPDIPIAPPPPLIDLIKVTNEIWYMLYCKTTNMTAEWLERTYPCTEGVYGATRVSYCVQRFCV